MTDEELRRQKPYPLVIM